MDVQSITWLQILQVGGLAGVISAFIGAGLKEISEHRERKRKARHLALKLSLILERYYHACADRASSINDFHGSCGNAGSNDVGLPDIEEMPSADPSWVYLDQSVADEVLSYPAALQAIDEGIHINVYQDSMPDGPDPQWTLGPLYDVAFRTIELARLVRSTHGLKAANRTKDSEARLREYRKDFQKKLGEQNSRLSLFDL